MAPSGGGKTHALALCASPAFSADSRWLACEATVSEAEQDKLKKAKKPIQNKMSVLELATGTVATVDDVQSLAFSGDAAFLAFRRYPTTRDTGGGPRGYPGGDAGRGDAEPSDPAGSALTIRNLATGSDTIFGNVTGYAWRDNGTKLYNSARRAGKPVVMLVYVGENHAVAQKANQLDYHRRINAWFDHDLKGEPAPEWITQGVTVLERERESKRSGKDAPAVN